MVVVFFNLIYLIQMVLCWQIRGFHKRQVPTVTTVFDSTKGSSGSETTNLFTNYFLPLAASKLFPSFAISCEHAGTQTKIGIIINWTACASSLARITDATGPNSSLSNPPFLALNRLKLWWIISAFSVRFLPKTNLPPYFKTVREVHHVGLF
jgi:hypothetical protein